MHFCTKNSVIKFFYRFIKPGFLAITLFIISLYFWFYDQYVAYAVITDTIALSILVVSQLWAKHKYKYVTLGAGIIALGLISQFISYYCSIGVNHSFIEYMKDTIHYRWDSTYYHYIIYVLAIGLYVYIFYKRDYNIKDDKQPLYNLELRKDGNSKPVILVIMISLSLVISGVVFYLLWIKAIQATLPMFWLLAIILSFFAIYFYERGTPEYDLLKLSRGEIFFLLMILVFMLSVMFYKITIFPFHVHCDEAQMGILAREYFFRDINLFSLNGWYGVPELGIYPMYTLFSYFGDSLFSLRLNSFLNGIISILPFYYFVRVLFNKQLAAISTILLFSSHVVIFFLRTGFHYSQGLVLLVLFISFLVVGLKINSKLFIYISGLFCALGFYAYFSARVLVIIAVLYFLYLLISYFKEKKIVIIYILLFSLGFLLVFYPVFIIAQNETVLFSDRWNEISILSQNGWNYTVLNSTYKDTFTIVAIKIIESIRGLFDIGDRMGQYAIPLPIVDFLSSIFLLFSAGLMLAKCKTERYVLLNIVFWMILIFGWVLTINSPSLHKMPIIMPVVAIMIGLAIVNLATLISNVSKDVIYNNKVYTSLVLTSLVIIITINFEYLFYEYAIKHIDYSINNGVRTAYSLNKYFNRNYDAYIVAPNENKLIVDFNNNIYCFLRPDYHLYKLPEDKRALPFKKAVQNNICFIILENNQFKEVTMLLKKYYPQGQLNIFTNSNYKPFLGIYTVKKEDINKNIPVLKKSGSR